MNRRSLGFWAGLVVFLILIGLVSGRQGRTAGDPYDPDSTDDDGTAALITLLDELGTDVRRGLPGEDTRATLMLADRLDVDQRRELEFWVEDGGTLVVADRFSPFGPAASTGFAVEVLRDPVCPLPGVAGLEIHGDTLVLLPSEPPASPPGAVPAEPLDDFVPAFEPTGRCFSVDGDGARRVGGDYLQVANRDRGRVIVVGGADPFTNRYLDEADNAVLAVELLTGGGADQGSLAVLYDPVFSPGSRGLRELLPSGFTWALWQLLVAFGLFVLWRARRFGSPVPEPQPVELPGSLLVRATGELHRRSGGTMQASAVLRADLENRMRRQLKVSAEVSVTQLVMQAARSTQLDPAIVTRALIGPVSGTPAELAALVAGVDNVNRGLAVSAPGPAPVATGETT
jgi:hypothetical protein